MGRVLGVAVVGVVVGWEGALRGALVLWVALVEEVCGGLGSRAGFGFGVGDDVGVVVVML